MSTHADYCILALTLWREARGEGLTGMKAVGCVVRNRVNRRGSTYYAECTRLKQFTSISTPGDPQLANWPRENDSTWVDAQLAAGNIIDGQIGDVTDGATMYYADSIPFPEKWDRSKLRQTVTIGRHIFFQEI